MEVEYTYMPTCGDCHKPNAGELAEFYPCQFCGGEMTTRKCVYTRTIKYVDHPWRILRWLGKKKKIVTKWEFHSKRR